MTITAMAPPLFSYGLPPPIPFSLNFSDFVDLLMGHYTSLV